MEKIYFDDYYKFFFENSLDAILLTKPDGSILGANPAACELFNMTEKEICHAGRSGLVDTTDPRLEKALAERKEKGKTRVELTFKRKDGSSFPGDLTSNLVYSSDGNVWTIIIIRDISIWKEAEELHLKEKRLLEEIATIDYLTKTLNRREFIRRLGIEMERMKREHSNLALVMIDLDHLKNINDSLGHSAGDIVLKRLAEVIEASLRQHDILGRYGGDEFVVCLPLVTFENARKIAERLRKRINTTKITFLNETLTMSASIGVAMYNFQSGENIDSLISKADKLMYRAKIKRNNVCF